MSKWCVTCCVKTGNPRGFCAQCSVFVWWIVQRSERGTPLNLAMAANSSGITHRISGAVNVLLVLYDQFIGAWYSCHDNQVVSVIHLQRIN